MKVYKYLLLAGLVSLTINPAHAGKAAIVKTDKPAAVKIENRPEVGEKQAGEVANFAKELIESTKSVSGPSQLFQYINNQNNNTDSPLEIVNAISAITASNKYRIICFQEGSDAVIASSDPTLLDVSINHTALRDNAVDALRKADKKQAVFTFETVSATVVNGKAVTKKSVAAVIGKKAFTNFAADEKKFVVVIVGDIDN